jgi:hypothetical protein
MGPINTIGIAAFGGLYLVWAVLLKLDLVRPGYGGYSARGVFLMGDSCVELGVVGALLLKGSLGVVLSICILFLALYGVHTNSRACAKCRQARSTRTTHAEDQRDE